METYLYFRKFRPASQSFTISATNVSNWANIDQGSATSFMEITGIGAAYNTAGYLIGSETEIASVSVKAVGSNSNVGSNISGGAVVADEVSSIPMAAVDIGNSRLRIEPATGSGDSDNKDTADGYTLVAGDIVTVNLQQGLETSVMYPASSLIGIEATATGQTTLRFKSLKNDGSDDIITIDHDATKYENIVEGINAIINGNNHGGVVTVVDGSGDTEASRIPRVNKALQGLGIDGLGIVLEASY
jgi:hypothetical protein